MTHWKFKPSCLDLNLPTRMIWIYSRHIHSASGANSKLYFPLTFLSQCRLHLNHPPHSLNPKSQEELDLSHNLISHLSPMVGTPALRSLNLAHNNINTIRFDLI